MSESVQSIRLSAAMHFVGHIGHRDFADFLDLLSDSVTYRALGEHSLSGIFSGREEVRGHLKDLVEASEGTMDAVKWDDWMQGEHHVSAIGTIHLQSGGRLFVGRMLFLIRFDIANKIDELVVFFEDARAIARAFDS